MKKYLLILTIQGTYKIFQFEIIAAKKSRNYCYMLSNENFAYLTRDSMTQNFTSSDTEWDLFLMIAER